MMESNWRVALDLGSLVALVATAVIAWAAYKLQKKTNERMDEAKVLERIEALEHSQSTAPTRRDIERMEDRIMGTERHVNSLDSKITGVQASVDGLAKLIAGVSSGVQVIQQHLLAQSRGGDE